MVKTGDQQEIALHRHQQARHYRLPIRFLEKTAHGIVSYYNSLFLARRQASRTFGKPRLFDASSAAIWGD